MAENNDANITYNVMSPNSMYQGIFERYEQTQAFVTLEDEFRRVANALYDRAGDVVTLTETWETAVQTAATSLTAGTPHHAIAATFIQTLIAADASTRAATKEWKPAVTEILQQYGASGDITILEKPSVAAAAPTAEAASAQTPTNKALSQGLSRLLDYEAIEIWTQNPIESHRNLQLPEHIGGGALEPAIAAQQRMLYTLKHDDGDAFSLRHNGHLDIFSPTGTNTLKSMEQAGYSHEIMDSTTLMIGLKMGAPNGLEEVFNAVKVQGGFATFPDNKPGMKQAAEPFFALQEAGLFDLTYAQVQEQVKQCLESKNKDREYEFQKIPTHYFEKSAAHPVIPYVPAQSPERDSAAATVIAPEPEPAPAPAEPLAPATAGLGVNLTSVNTYRMAFEMADKKDYFKRIEDELNRVDTALTARAGYISTDMSVLIVAARVAAQGLDEEKELHKVVADLLLTALERDSLVSNPEREAWKAAVTKALEDYKHSGEISALEEVEQIQAAPKKLSALLEEMGGKKPSSSALGRSDDDDLDDEPEFLIGRDDVLAEFEDIVALPEGWRLALPEDFTLDADKVGALYDAVYDYAETLREAEPCHLKDDGPEAFALISLLTAHAEMTDEARTQLRETLLEAFKDTDARLQYCTATSWRLSISDLEAYFNGILADAPQELAEITEAEPVLGADDAGALTSLEEVKADLDPTPRGALLAEFPDIVLPDSLRDLLPQDLTLAAEQIAPIQAAIDAACAEIPGNTRNPVHRQRALVTMLALSAEGLDDSAREAIIGDLNTALVDYLQTRPDAQFLTRFDMEQQVNRYIDLFRRHHGIESAIALAPGWQHYDQYCEALLRGEEPPPAPQSPASSPSSTSTDNSYSGGYGGGYSYRPQAAKQAAPVKINKADIAVALGAVGAVAVGMETAAEPPREGNWFKRNAEGLAQAAVGLVVLGGADYFFRGERSVVGKFTASVKSFQTERQR